MKKALALVLAALLTLSGCSQTDTIYANFRAVVMYIPSSVVTKRSAP